MAVRKRVRRPNREKAASKLVKWLVVTGLLATVVLSAITAFGGWGTMQGAKALFVFLVLLNVAFAVLVAIWNRGVLPVIIAFATMYGIFAAVSAPQWFQRDKPGLTSPTFDEPILGTLCLIIVAVQAVLIVLAAVGFQQKWNIEEIDRSEIEKPARGDTAPAPA